MRSADCAAPSRHEHARRAPPRAGSSALHHPSRRGARRPPRRAAARRPRTSPETTVRPGTLVWTARSCRPAALAPGESAEARRLHLNGTPYPSNSPARQAPPLDPGPTEALSTMCVASAQVVSALAQHAAGERRARGVLEPTTRLSVRAETARRDLRPLSTAEALAGGAIGLRMRVHLPPREWALAARPAAIRSSTRMQPWASQWACYKCSRERFASAVGGIRALR
jgi:hypothetical protein